MTTALARHSVVAALIAGVVLTSGCASNAPDTTAVSTDASPAPALQVDEEFQPFDTPPTLEKYVEPEYPAYAKKHAIMGVVTLRIVVSAKGRVDEVRVLESTDRMFDAPAIDAAKQFRFKPARLNGEPVQSAVAVPVRFRY
jgi:periplasmic protein TonB